MPSPAHRHAFRPALLTLLAAALLAGPVTAQRLPELLPAETFLALGAVGLQDHADVLDDFVTEWERLGVGPALERALRGLTAGPLPLGLPSLDTAPPGELELPDELKGLDPYAVLGREAWLAVSVSTFNPLPALTLVALVDEATGARFDAVIARAGAERGALRLQEGAASFVVTARRDGLALAASRFGELLALSTNPDVLRSVLRQAQGSPDRSFTDGDAFARTLATLGPGELVGFLDAHALATAIAPIATGLGFDASVTRLRGLLATVGTGAGVLRVVPDGLASESVQVVRGSGSDTALATLLTDPAPAPRALLAAVPEGALSVSLSATSPAGWWDYLGDLVAGLRELAIPDLDRLLRDLAGVEVRRDLTRWTGPGLLSVSTGGVDVVEPGVPATQLLGDGVTVLVARDERAAREGLARLLDGLGSTLSAFTDPFGRGGPVVVDERTVAGVTVRTYRLFPGASVSTAVTGGLAVIGTSEEATDASVAAIARGGGGLPPTLARLLDEVPADATAFTLSDDAAVLAGSTAGLAAQVQLLAGLGGGALLDFDATVEATDALEAFLSFLAGRLGGSVSWTTVDGPLVRTVGRTEVAWR